MAYTPYYPGGWDDSPSTSTPIVAAALNHMETGIGAGLQLQASTGAAGFALTNGTPTILTWTAPADGQLHRLLVAGTFDVTTAQTGGSVNLTAYTPGGASEMFLQVAPGEAGTGSHTFTAAPMLIIGSGTVVTLYQASAQTAGAATVWAELWGA